MSTQDPGSARPARLAGLVLMGVAVIALVLGVITLINGGKSTNNGGAAQPTTTRTTGTATSRPGSSQPGTPTTTTKPASTTQQPPPATTTTTQQPAPPPPNNRAVPIQVLNNSKITGLARRASNDFKADGWNVISFGNYSQQNIPASTAYYRPGTAGEAAAKELAAKFTLQTDTRFPPALPDPGNGVVVIVTNDYGSK